MNARALIFVLAIVALGGCTAQVAPLSPASVGPVVRMPVVEMGDFSPTLGRQDARVWLVVFSDFQCRHCARASEAIRNLAGDYPNDLRVIFKHFPIMRGDLSAKAARAAIAAHLRGKFWEMEELIFDDQERLTEDHLFRLAEQIGLGIERFNVDYNRRETVLALKQDVALGNRLGLDRTPSIIMNGYLLPGSLSAGELRGLVEYFRRVR